MALWISRQFGTAFTLVDEQSKNEVTVKVIGKDKENGGIRLAIEAPQQVTVLRDNIIKRKNA